jgi:pilus assembly protein CpaE
LTRFFRQLAGNQARPVEKLIVVMGTKGGVGASTVAVNLGVQLTRLTQKRVVLLDFARPLGYVSILLDLQPRFSLCSGADNLDRLDTHFFGDLQTRHPSGLEVLAGTSSPDEWQSIPLAALTRVVEIAQKSSDFVLMDLGSVYSSEWSPILSLADKILLVAEAMCLPSGR